MRLVQNAKFLRTFMARIQIDNNEALFLLVVLLAFINFREKAYVRITLKRNVKKRRNNWATIVS